MNRDEAIRAVAELVAGLQVPVSLRLPLGAAREPWGKLHEVANGGFGWYDADKAEVALRAVFNEERQVEFGRYVRDSGRWKWVPRITMNKTDMLNAIDTFNAVVDRVEARCMAADGDVTPTLGEMREDELRELWRAVQVIKETV